MADPLDPLRPLVAEVLAAARIYRESAINLVNGTKALGPLPPAAVADLALLAQISETAAMGNGAQRRVCDLLTQLAVPAAEVHGAAAATEANRAGLAAASASCTCADCQRERKTRRESLS